MTTTSSHYFHVRSTREQIQYVDDLITQGINNKFLNRFAEHSMASGLLGETVVKDLFGLMRSSYRVADGGVDLEVNQVKIDVKTTGFNRTVRPLDRIVLIKKDWLDYHEKDKNTDVLLFIGHDKEDNTIHFLGWVGVKQLKSGVETGEVRIVKNGDTIAETHSKALTDTLVIPVVSLHRFADPDDFAEQMMELKTAPPREWTFTDTPKKAVEAPVRPQKPVVEAVAPILDPITFQAAEARIDDCTTIFTIVCRSALTASKMRVWLAPTKSTIPEPLKRITGAPVGLKVCHYCNNGFNRPLAGRPPALGRYVCKEDECQERYKQDKDKAKAGQ